MRLSENEKELLRANFDCPPGTEMNAYLMLVRSVRPWLRPRVGWWRFGKMKTPELLEAFMKGPDRYSEETT
ncbi:MAG TPA: hypothetical protein VF944_11590 [Candidatus Bathyarchaeia archaeon]